MTERFRKSMQHLQRARKVIPDGAQEFTRFHSPWLSEPGPRFLDRTLGSRVWDIDGNEYLDPMMALGPIGLGYGHPRVEEAILRQLRRGITASLPSTLEAELAERLSETFPGVAQVRFGKSGSDVTAAALRIARVHTGRDQVLACGYHGWHDWCLAAMNWRTDWLAGVPPGVRESVHPFDYDDLGALERLLVQHRGQVAAVILEPMNVQPPSKGYLEGVRRLTREHGAVLIFDDMLNAYRFARGGSGEYFGVIPDMVTAGKALANGMPLSAVMGNAEVMRSAQDILFSGSFLSETLSLAAAIATHEVYRQERVIEHIWKQGERLKEAVGQLIQKHGMEDRCYLLGHAPHFLLLFRNVPGGLEGQQLRARFQELALERGVLFTGAHFISYAHSEADIDQIASVYDDVFAALRKAGT